MNILDSVIIYSLNAFISLVMNALRNGKSNMFLSSEEEESESVALVRKIILLPFIFRLKTTESTKNQCALLSNKEHQ